MKTSINVGVIGLGFMGSTHFRIHQNHPLAKVVAVADIDEAKRKGDWRKVWGNIGDANNNDPVDMTGIQAYEDAFEMINNPNIDLVDICVPTYLHKQYVLAALKAGKNVMTEKPISRTGEDALEILEAYNKSGKSMVVGMCVRYWPEYQHAYQLIQSGKLGKIKTATFKRVSPNVAGNAWEDWYMNEKRSGGALLDLHLHDTDVIHYFFGKPKKVTSFGIKGFRSDAGYDHIFTNYEYEENMLVFSEGSWAPATGTPFEMSFLIIGEKGTIRLSETGYKVIYEDGTVENPTPANPDLPTGWHVEIDYLLKCIAEGVKPEKYLTIEQMVDSITIVEAEAKSIAEKQTIEINYPEK
jgi:predicted dehydrogenase